MLDIVFYLAVVVLEWTIEKQVTLPLPPPRGGALSAVTPGGDLWMFGGWPGSNKQTLDDTWHFESKSRSWKQISLTGPKPERRYMGHACYYDEKFVIFGGHQLSTNKVLNDVWYYCLNESKWFNITFKETQIGPRASAASWCVDSQMFVFGGIDTEKIYQDMWVLQMDESMTWRQIFTEKKPVPRFGSATWMTKNGSDLYLFGGSTKYPAYENSVLNDMWIFSIFSGNFTQLQRPYPINSNRRIGYYGDMQKGDLRGQPGGRMWSSTWVDDCGYLWLFSGQGLGEKTKENPNPVWGIQSDLWYYTPSDNVWITSGGFQFTNMRKSAEHYGQASIDIFPGSRWICTTWAIKNDMYLFGGIDFNGENTGMEDLWHLTWTTLIKIRAVPARPIEEASIYTLSFLIAGIMLVVIIFGAIITKYLCKKREKPRHANVKYQKLQTEETPKCMIAELKAENNNILVHVVKSMNILPNRTQSNMNSVRV